MINFSGVNQPICVYFEATISILLSKFVLTNYLELMSNTSTAIDGFMVEWMTSVTLLGICYFSPNQSL